MPDFAAQRANMVAAQLRTNDVTDARLRAAMLTIARERFVPERLAALAYREGNLEIAAGRVLLDPRCFAKLVQLAQVRGEDRVLDVGCASGYSTMVLSLLAKEVVGIEEDAALANLAAKNLSAMGAHNAQIVQRRLAEGGRERAPFAVIVLNGAVDGRPETLLTQLAEGGRLVCVVRNGAAGHAHLYVKSNGAIGERSAFDAQAPVLPGFEKRSGFVF